jgi:hypothetical protein
MKIRIASLDWRGPIIVRPHCFNSDVSEQKQNKSEILVGVKSRDCLSAFQAKQLNNKYLSRNAMEDII